MGSLPHLFPVPVAPARSEQAKRRGQRREAGPGLAAVAGMPGFSRAITDQKRAFATMFSPPSFGKIRQSDEMLNGSLKVRGITPMTS